MNQEKKEKMLIYRFKFQEISFFLQYERTKKYTKLSKKMLIQLIYNQIYWLSKLKIMSINYY
jgi:hypothetical protein